MSEKPSQHGAPISPLSFENPFTGGETVSGHGVEKWLLEGLALGASHTLIWCDTFDFTDYPHHVMPGEDVRSIIEANNNKEMQRLMEVYWLGGNLDEQLAQTRSMTFGPKED